MRYLTVEEVLALHTRLLEQFGGSEGLRDRGALESAVAGPQATFGGEDLYPTLSAKAAALVYSLVQNHPFVDGNKRTGHAAMEAFLVLNDYEIAADTDEQEQLILSIATGETSRDALRAWLEGHLVKYRKE